MTSTTGSPGSTLNARARGWLRFIWDKATTPDDWSSAGEPLPWWDRESTSPMCSFPRFDLGETSYGLPLVADATPAWREVYTRIAAELCDRHTTFWAAADWLTLMGSDPNVDRYPPEWLIFIPERRRGAYAPPGWTGNGIEPWGLAPDPIGADGNLFFRGFFNLLLGVHSYVSGDDKYRRPFPVTGYLDRQFTWTHQDIASFISQQLADRPEGPHCENTKVWPFCISAAGLGLKLYDAVHDTTLQRPYDSWTEFASLCITPYVFPQNPGFATDLYEKSCRLLGWSNAKARVNQFVPDPRFLSIGLLMAREIGDTTTESRLREVVERDFQPRSFGDESDRFGFFFDWGEPYPRGQPSALLILTEVGEPGAWSRVFNQPNLDKFHEPTVEGIDYPTLGVSTARNVRHSGELHVDTYAATPSGSGRSTTWRVTQLPDSSTVRITCDGADFTSWRVLGQHEIELTTSVGDHRFSIRTGYHGEPVPRLAGSEGSGSEGSSLGGFGSGGSSSGGFGSGGFGSGQPGDTRSATNRGVAPTVRGARPPGPSASTGPCGCC